MARCKSTMIAKIEAVDGAKGGGGVPEWASTLAIQNALTTPAYLAFRRAALLDPAPGPTNGYDYVLPGSATTVVPVPSDADISFVAVQVIYGGAVPSGDVGLFLTITALETQQTPGATPLA